MYIVTIENNGYITEIHGKKQKLKSGNVVKGINSIDTFSFSLLPSNVGFNSLFEYQTIVRVYNTNKKRYEFQGRVLYTNPSMSDKGAIAKDVVCESFFGYLCDSKQTYVDTRNWTVLELFQHLIDTHNSQLEDCKRFVIGEVTVTDKNDNLYCGIQREDTWTTIKTKLIDVLGGEIRFRIVDDVIFIDYLTQIGSVKATPIKLGQNMKSISQEKDPSAYITRLIPLGAKHKGEDGTESEERLDITTVNDGINYIDDEQAIERYGIHVGYVEFDDVTVASNLLTKGRNWLVNNNKVKMKYSITALDLSLLGLNFDDFDTHNYHPLINPLLGIDDVARIIKKSIDVCEEMKSTIEVGENFKTLNEIQNEQSQKTNNVIEEVGKIKNDYVTNEKLKSSTSQLETLIQQTGESIVASVAGTYVTKDAEEELRKSVMSELELLEDALNLKFTEANTEIKNVDGDLQTKFEEVYKFFTFTENGLKIHSGDNEMSLVLDNDVIAFYKGTVKFGEWDGVDFRTGNIIIELEEKAQFGNFAFVPRSDGSLSFLKLGDY